MKWEWGRGEIDIEKTYGYKGRGEKLTHAQNSENMSESGYKAGPYRSKFMSYHFSKNQYIKCN